MLAIVLLANFQIFKFCCDIQGLHLIGYLWVSLIIDQSECLICYFLCTELTLFCTELTLFCTELPENCIYLYQSDLNNFFMYIIKTEITSPILSNLFYFHQNMICTYKCIELKTPCVGFVLSHFLIFQSFFFNFKVALLSKVIGVDALPQKVTKKLKNHRDSVKFNMWKLHSNEKQKMLTWSSVEKISRKMSQHEWVSSYSVKWSKLLQ